MDELHKDAWLAATFDRVGVEYPRTELGNPSFKGGNKGWMTGHAHWLPSLVAKIERYHDASFKFLQGYILDHIVNGRIHASIHPHRTGSDIQRDRGAKSSRFSYSDPPLQQMPSRDKEITPLMRGVFLPEEGQVWAKLDASQREFRLVVHFACERKLTGAEAACEEYINNPDADIHQYTADTTGIDRQSGKTFNFAKIYGAGVKRLAEHARTRRSSTASSRSTRARGVTSTATRRGASGKRAPAPVISKRPSGVPVTPIIPGIAGRLCVRIPAPHSTHSSKDRPRGTPSGGCATSGASCDSCRCSRCTMPWTARSSARSRRKRSPSSANERSRFAYPCRSIAATG
jgi:hypothetical protein